VTVPSARHITVTRDLVYRQVNGFRAQSLDLFVPTEPVALCVYLHGGGWRVGSRRAGPGPLSPLSGLRFEHLAQSGLAVASIDYRLSGEATFPAQLDDVQAALSWLRVDRPDVGSLPLVLFGVSAGGTLAALTGLDPALGAVAIAIWYAVTDLAAMPADLGMTPDAAADPTTREALFLGAPAADVPDLARAASPACQVTSAAPPFLLIHGDADNAVPLAQSERLHRALTAVGAEATLCAVPGYDHMFSGMSDGELRVHLDRTATFLTAAAGRRS
jgi:acetyl esterase/lipase